MPAKLCRHVRLPLAMLRRRVKTVREGQKRVNFRRGPGSRKGRRAPLCGLPVHHHVIERQLDRVGEGVAHRAHLLQMVDEPVDPFLR